ncbi:sulfate ABC transporter permease subunit [Longimicrobium sp.]|uniref:sulfate ABC transporter permease subunit n=1 Tax=Longimicrobium sp. TaxID=2029185 RepID=UPI003B3A2A57
MSEQTMQALDAVHAPRPPAPQPGSVRERTALAAAARRRRSIPWGRGLLIAAVLAYLAIVLILPLAALVTRALAEGPADLARALTSPGALAGLWHSVIVVALALLFNGTLGVAGAIVLVRHRFWGRRVLDLLVDLPLAVSPVMVGLAFLLVFGRGGWLRPATDALGMQVAFAFTGVVLVTLFVTLPYTIREVGYVLAELGTAEEEVAATLGATPWQTFRRVTLPNVRNALGAGLTLTAARALGEFGAAVVVGGAISGRTQTATTYIYGEMEARNTAGAYGMALLLAIVSTVLLLVLRRAESKRKR